MTDLTKAKLQCPQEASPVLDRVCLHAASCLTSAHTLEYITQKALPRWTIQRSEPPITSTDANKCRVNITSWTSPHLNCLRPSPCALPWHLCMYVSTSACMDRLHELAGRVERISLTKRSCCRCGRSCATYHIPVYLSPLLIILVPVPCILPDRHKAPCAYQHSSVFRWSRCNVVNLFSTHLGAIRLGSSRLCSR